MFEMPPRERILERYEQAKKRIEDFHIRTFPEQPGPIFLISTAYPGVWMEHAFDAVCYARLNPDSSLAKDVARSQMLLFLRNQRPDGHLPFNVVDTSLNTGRLHPVGYSQIQECVSFARLCLEVYEITGDMDFLKEAYAGCARWDKWLCDKRMTRGTGLIELFCLYDTGHDNSARLADVPVQCPDTYGETPVDSEAVPMLAPDMNAVFYGDRKALADMARVLGRDEEAAEWERKAADVREKMLNLLYDKQDEFFYDLDAKGNMRRFPSIAISNVFTEHVLTQAEFDAIYDRHMRNPAEFWTEYPFPSMAVNSPVVNGHAPQNCWGYYSQALTALRCQRWMDYYGRSADYDHLLSRWVAAIASHDGKLFTQELDPLTGNPTNCSEWYSSAMLMYMYAVKRLGYIE